MQVCFLSCMAKVFAHGIPARYRPQNTLSGFANESLCFQLAFCADAAAPLHLQYANTLPLAVCLVGEVPVGLAANPSVDDDYVDKQPGQYPDLLQPLDARKPFAARSGWQALYLEISPGSLAPGQHTLAFALADEAGATLWQGMLPIHILPNCLPQQTLPYTRWFHCDSLAQYYDVPMFSARHFEIMEAFLRKAAQRGQNMVLTPIHTPPLDTAQGAYRLPAQLVGIQQAGGRYTFDFSLLDRWLAMCGRCGIRYFEMAHLYTQWGARFAPQILAQTDAGPRRIFGWDTPATGPDYHAFLAQYLPALAQHLQKAGVAERCFFHISDEPNVDQLDDYLAAKAQAAPYLQGFPIMDALSDMAIYRASMVQHPVVANDHIEPFLAAQVPGLWTYYCCGQGNKVSNSLIAMPGERTRVLGVQLYKFGIQGFLHWGLNFYFSQLSRYPVSPYEVTDAGGAFPGGDPFIFYPLEDGTPADSLRSLLTQKALEDMRALQLLEAYKGRSYVLALIDEGLEHPLTFSNYPRDEQYLLSLRQRVEEQIRQAGTI